MQILPVITAVLAVVATGIGQCPLSFTIAVVQDLTQEHLATLQADFPALVDHLRNENPRTRIGLVSFTDHGVVPLGVPGETCVTMDQKLTTNRQNMLNAYAGLVPAGGGDDAQGQLFAVHHALLTGDMKWRLNGSVNADDIPIVNVVLLITDSLFHEAGDGIGAGMSMMNDGDEYVKCGLEDYPTLPQVTEAFNGRRSYFAALVAGSSNLPAYNDLIANTVGPTRGHVEILADSPVDIPSLQSAAVAALTAIADKYCAVCASETALEVVYVQDVSHSNAVAFTQMKAEATALFRNLQTAYPFMRIGFASFSDKPIPPFGYAVSMDYCYWLHHGLREDLITFDSHLQSLIRRSGNDWKESSMDAIFQLATDPAVDFTTSRLSNDRVVRRVIIVATDAAPHVAGDGLPHGLTAHDGLPGLDCTGEDYPSLAQVGDALQAMRSGPSRIAFAVPPFLNAEYSAIALQWGALGTVFAGVYPNADPLAALNDAIRGMADPCGAMPGARRLEGLQSSLLRGLAAPPLEFHTPAQPPIEPTLEEIMKGVKPRR